MANGVRVWIVLLLAFLVSPVLSMAPASVPDDGSGPGGGAPVQGHQPSEGRSGQRAAGEPARPDLVLNELNWSLAGMYDGAQGMLFATVFNDGAHVSAPFSVDMYVDGDPAGTAVVNGLAGGSFTTVKAPWTASSGDHELAARVDLTDQIAESNETNNLKVAYIDIPFPDLVISNVSWYPQDFREGDTVTFAITIANIGTGSTTRTFVLEAFMGQARLGNLIFAGLGSGNTALGTLQWSAKAGDHVLFLTIDSGGAVQEANELNNRYMAGLGQDFPDILLKDVSVSPPQLTDGAQAVLRATVENRGKGGTIQQFTVAFIIDGETVGGAGVYGLAPNASNSVSVSWKVRAGHHDLRVLADSNSEVAESIESNNLKVMPFNVSFPDLVVKDLRWEPTVPTDGRPVRLNITVSNIGEGSTARPFFVGVMADGVTIADLEVPGLRSGEE